MSDGPCCAHLTVLWKTVESGGLTSGWWQCSDCETRFAPVREILLEAAIRQSLEAMRAMTPDEMAARAMRDARLAANVNPLRWVTSEEAVTAAAAAPRPSLWQRIRKIGKG